MKIKTMTKTMTELKAILEDHVKYLRGEEGGARADLSNTDLHRADLRNTDLSGANLSKTNLSGANLVDTNLSEADLHYANLSAANLSGTDLRHADLRWANLHHADLSGTGLKIFQAGEWTAYIWRDHIRIACQCHSTSEWKTFTDIQIDAMHKTALACWKENKTIILAIADSIAKTQDLEAKE